VEPADEDCVAELLESLALVVELCVSATLLEEELLSSSADSLDVSLALSSSLVLVVVDWVLGVLVVATVVPVEGSRPAVRRKDSNVNTSAKRASELNTTRRRLRARTSFRLIRAASAFGLYVFVRSFMLGYSPQRVTASR
jgi:hypothetical protein